MDNVFREDINSDRLLRTAIEVIGLEAGAAKRMLKKISKNSTNISTIVKAEAVLKVHAAEMTKNRASSDMFKANYFRRMTEAEAGAFEQDPVDIVIMKVNGKLTKTILHDRNRAEYIRQIEVKEQGVKLVYSGDQNGAARELGYQNALEARRDLVSKTANANSGFSEAESRLRSSIALQENYKQIFINKHYEMNTETNLMLIFSALKLLLGIAGLADVLGIKMDDPTENFKNMPEKIQKKADNQVGKLVYDFNDKLLRMQKASSEKKVAEKLYKMEHPAIADRFTSI